MKDFIIQQNEATLQSYRVRPAYIKEHAGIEQGVLAGGYGYRQILELVQNGADAILEAHEGGVPPVEGNRIEVLLRGSSLYVANTGAPLSRDGIEALLTSHSSPKRGNQIGRFGLGFKSLLQLGGPIDLFMQSSGAIRFDPQRCRDRLKQEFGVQQAPSLRLAWPLDECDGAVDAVIESLAWAETIVRVHVQVSDLLEHLRRELASFPAEFLLFFPVTTSLALDDGNSPRREINVERNGSDLLLHDGTEYSRWRVAAQNVSIVDERARRDATEIHSRDSVPLAWAIPLDGKKEEAGRFWAFFPTQTLTHLPGILNAPWKLNSDRNSVIGGEWNTALMNEAARLVAETMPSLSTADDPARPLDAFPRQLERKDEVAVPLVEAVWNALKTAPVIPAATSVLRPANDLWRHPTDSAALARRWQSITADEELGDIVHPSCLDRQRSSRLNALAERCNAAADKPDAPPSLKRRSPESWFEACASADAPCALSVLKLAEEFANDCKQGVWRKVRPELSIIPSHSGELLTPGKLILAPVGTIVPGRTPVDPSLCEDSDALRILTEVMGVKALDDSVWQSALSESLTVIPGYPRDAQESGWQAFWSTLRAAPNTVRQNFVAYNRSRIRVRRQDGNWVSADNSLLPGSLVSTDDNAGNQKMLVDLTTHGADHETLKVLGIVDFPEGTVNAKNELNSLSSWLNDCRSLYKRTYDNPASWDYLEPVSLEMPTGWRFLLTLSGVPNAKLTERFMCRLAEGDFPARLQFGHSDRRYPRMEVTHPLPGLLFKHGYILLGKAPVRLQAIVDKRNEPAMSMIANISRLADALDRLAEFAQPASSAEVQDFWHALIQTLATPSAVANDSLNDLWAGAARDGVVPSTLSTFAGAIPLSDVFITGSPDLARHVRSPDRIVITLDSAAMHLWLSRGARDLSTLIRPEFASESGPPELLVSSFPDVADVLNDDAKDSALGRPVVDLRLRVPGAADPIPCLMWENSLLFDSMQLFQLPRAARLAALIREIAAADWLKCEPEHAMQSLGDAQVDERRAKVARGRSLAERLTLAVGNRAEPLRAALGELSNAEFVKQCTLEELAELVLAQRGPAALVAVRDALEAEGLKPPSRWSSPEARSFVASIQFPQEFAVSLQARRDAEEYVSGPINLPPLHDFQEEVLNGIRGLINKGAGRRRAVVCLPTGGGKTRVTVEGAVRLVLEPEGRSRSVVWIAQTDELCEQAVQAFRQVWVNLGSQKTDLRIIRLWGGHPNPVPQDSEMPVVVVASIQTLNSRMTSDGLAWLKKPGAVIVDECHHAITPSYSNLLRWLDADATQSEQADREEPLIIGLSATPFRMDDEQSERLAKRFDNRWFPADQEKLHSRLRLQGVLAEAHYEELQSGIGLLPNEIEQLSQLGERWEGIALENILEAINQRLAGDSKRNEQLVNRIQRCQEQSILFFANSLRHAFEMSARLNLAGIPAAAISGDRDLTPVVARRYFLDRFQRGEIRVLCNHSVLTTGFDAPKTDMVLIARQVFSPVRFMQMVGRGLRGKENGGTVKCQIVTVIDNLGRFQDRHPYHYCREYYHAMLD